MPAPDKYGLYQRSVQSPGTHTEWFITVYRDLFDRYPRHLREDFCGTFHLSTEWVRRNRRNTAVALDLDEEPLRYGRRANLKTLSAEQKSRIEILRQDVRLPTVKKAELIAACNFSFYIFKQRAELIKYFRACRRSLRQDGALLLEMAGGPGMIAKLKETKSVRGRGANFTYIWDQRSFNPITADARYAIHFKLPSGRLLRSAFTYDWRLWTIPEVREALIDAGFDEAHVYWESSHQGAGTGEYIRTDEGDNAYSWIAYVAGVMRK